MRSKLNRRFFQGATETVARKLLGQRLIHKCLKTGDKFSGIIVETEAYLGLNDPACHTFGGKKTARTWLPIKSEQKYLRAYKVSQRKDLDISSVNASFNLEFDKYEMIKEARVVYGGVAATILRLNKIEKLLVGKSKNDFNIEFINQVQNKIMDEITPLADVRSDAENRKTLAGNLFKKYTFETGLCRNIW